jgi:hypothetical protein
MRVQIYVWCPLLLLFVLAVGGSSCGLDLISHVLFILFEVKIFVPSYISTVLIHTWLPPGRTDKCTFCKILEEFLAKFVICIQNDLKEKPHDLYYQ